MVTEWTGYVFDGSPSLVHGHARGILAVACRLPFLAFGEVLDGNSRAWNVKG